MKFRLSLLVAMCSIFLTYAQESYTLSHKSVLKIKGTSTLHDWEVTANAIDGSIGMDLGTLTNLKIQVEVAQIKSERGATMDKKMHTALKGGEANPNIFFEFEGSKKLEGTENTYPIDGLLSIAGVTTKISIPSTLKQSGETYCFKGKKEIKLRDFNIEPPTAMFGQIVVGEMVTIDFDLVFEKE